MANHQRLTKKLWTAALSPQRRARILEQLIARSDSGHWFTVLAQAERHLTRSPDLPSPAERDAILNAVLQPDQRRWNLWYLGVPAAAVAAAALLIALWPADTGRFRARGPGTEAEWMAQAHCVQGEQMVANAASCARGQALVITVRNTQPRSGLVFATFTDAAGTVHQLPGAESGLEIAAGVGVRTLASSFDLDDAYALGDGELAVELCSACSAAVRGDARRPAIAESPSRSVARWHVRIVERRP